MALGDLVISLSCNTAQFQSDMGKANQVLERMAAKSIQTSQQAEAAVKVLTNAGVTSVDRLQQSFNALNIKSQLNIETEKARLQSAFEQIKNSGVASASEINRAFKAMNEQVAQVETGTNKSSFAFNAFSLSAIANLAKVQLMYQAVNAILSALFNLPRQAIDAMDNYNASAIKTASMLVSFNAGKGNIGEQYKQAKEYALGLQDALVGVSKMTKASAEQLSIMNLELQKSRIFLDPTKQSQVKGFAAISDAIATLTSGQPNQNMQFSQEIRGLMSGVDKPGNVLLGVLKSIDPLLVQHLETWKQEGSVIEHIGEMLIGFKAASGDVASLWSTIKTTFSSLYDQTIRGGLTPAFNYLVSSMQSFNNLIDENSAKISQVMLRSWLAIKGLVESVGTIFSGWNPILSNMGSLVAKIFEGWGLIFAVALPTVAEKLMNIVHILNAIVNAVMLTGVAFIDFVGTLGTGIVSLGKAAFQALTGDFEGAGKTLGTAFEGVFAERLKDTMYAIKGTMIAIGEESSSLFNLSGFDKRMSEYNATVQKHKAVAPADVAPLLTPVKEHDQSRFNEFVQAYRSAVNEGVPDTFERQLEKINDKFSDLKTKFESLDAIDKANLFKELGISASELQPKLDALKESVRQVALEKELASSESIINAFNAAAVKSEDSPLERELSRIDEQANKVKSSLEHASEVKKFFLSGQGVTSSSIDENFNAWKDRVRADDAYQKQVLAFKQQVTNIDETGKMSDMSSVEMTKQKLVVEEQLLAIQQLHNDKASVATQKEIEQLQYILYQRTAMGGITTALKQIADDASNLGAQINNFTKTMFKGMEDALVQFVTTGKMNFTSLANSIINDLARIAIQQSMTGLLASALGGIASMFASSYATTPTQPSYGEGVSGTAGNSWYSPVANLGSTAKVPSFAVGTDYVPQDMLAMIHEGEKITPKEFNTSGAGDAPGVIVNIENKTGNDVSSKQVAPKFDGKQWVIGIILENVNNNGVLRNMMVGAR